MLHMLERQTGCGEGLQSCRLCKLLLTEMAPCNQTMVPNSSTAAAAEANVAVHIC